jgi:alkylhydroperoxidase/carboxymuconolactone decarboxylase family protein YurZ
MVLDGERRSMSHTARFQETLRKLAMIDEGFVKDEAGLALSSVATSALDPKTARLLQVGASVTIGPSPVCLQWSVARAMAADATKDEIADVLLAIAPVAGLSRIAAAASDVAIALGYDVAAALEELDQIVLRVSEPETPRKARQALYLGMSGDHQAAPAYVAAGSASRNLRS